MGFHDDITGLPGSDQPGFAYLQWWHVIVHIGFRDDMTGLLAKQNCLYATGDRTAIPFACMACV
jgi:hypothetical protein